MLTGGRKRRRPLLPEPLALIAAGVCFGLALYLLYLLARAALP